MFAFFFQMISQKIMLYDVCTDLFPKFQTFIHVFLTIYGDRNNSLEITGRRVSPEE